MRDDHVIGIAAIGEHSETAWFETQILVAAAADRAFAAPDPWIGQQSVADRNALSVRAHCNHFADVLMPQCQRQLHAALGHDQFAAAAQVIIAIPDMKVGMTDAGGLYFQKHFSTRGLRRWLIDTLQRRSTFAHAKA